MKKKKSAFTLAETLLALTIIGVLSVIMINSVSTSTNEAETVMRVRKTQQLIEDTFMQSIAEEDSVMTWYNNLTDEGKGTQTKYATALGANYIAQKLKLKSNCYDADGSSFDSKCFPTSVKTLAGSNFFSKALEGTDLDQNLFTTFKLIDGSSVALSFFNAENCTDSLDSNDTVCGVALVDVDGNKGFNTFGQDIFSFLIYSDRVLPAGVGEEPKDCVKDTSISGCTAWLVMKGNMDYLKCPNNLDWNDKTKSTCPSDVTSP